MRDGSWELGTALVLLGLPSPKSSGGPQERDKLSLFHFQVDIFQNMVRAELLI